MIKSLFLETPNTEHTATGTDTLSTHTGGSSSAASATGVVAGAKQKRILTTPFTLLTTETSRKLSGTAAEKTAVTAGGKVVRA